MNDLELGSLEGLKGIEYRDLELKDKARIMSRVLTPELSSPKLAKKLAKLLKGKDHDCGPETCHNSCHYVLKAKAFDLLWAMWMR